MYKYFNGFDVKKLKKYSRNLSINVNRKGVPEIDTVKGCFEGIKRYPDGGCYGLCYAFRSALFYGYDFSESISRENVIENFKSIKRTLIHNKLKFFRIGTMGDPCHDWELTLMVCSLFYKIKIPVIVTKHWLEIPENMISKFKKFDVIFNTSISPLDTDNEIQHRLLQFNRIKRAGIKSVLRVVSCSFGENKTGRTLKKKQKYIFSHTPVIDNPLRISKHDVRVCDGTIKISQKHDMNKITTISTFNNDVFIGKCFCCPDQCGVSFFKNFKFKKEQGERMPHQQLNLIEEKIEFECVESVIGSGYEEDVAKLAIEDKVAYRAARKNMQIHSAIILKIDGVFSGFFTFEVNHIAKEFCLLQSAMLLDRKDKEIYSNMVKEIIKQNTFGYPMIMTVSTKHDLECPKVFEAIGFQTYLKLSGFEYMVHGTFDQIRMKRLAHATMTNAWTTTRADWLKMKKEWNGKIEAVGEKYNIPNPRFASRDGCWQGKDGFSNIVLSDKIIEAGKVVHKKGKSFNGNASVLDPVACEVILRFFMPVDGKRVYNPFGGGVQFGFISGSYGYEYVASEIRKNQCDCNNILCQDFGCAKWIQSDSSTYEPDGMFDLVFSCPPYYKVEKYVDYEGVIPDGEINSLPTYSEFRDTLFSGYAIAINHLKDDRFFVVMTGDSRDKNGAYYCCEAEHELFLRDMGLSVYNKIVYLECEFTRLAQAKKTLNYRKFPKREQKIIVAYKGDIKKIKDNFPNVGRL